MDPRERVADETGRAGEVRPQTRAEFIRRAALGALGAATISGQAAPAESVSHWKGKTSSKVKRWDIMTIGNLSRNRYWGESDTRAIRSAICTCTVIQGEGFRLLVDPSLDQFGEMAKELDRRTGLKLQDIDTVFVTHEHSDHFAALAHFARARWCAGPEVATALKKAKLPKSVEPVTDRLFDAIEIVPTPGHTMSHCSLRFDWEGLSVLVAGDAVATRDFWRDRRGYYNCVDFELSKKSMAKIADLADLVVPGHENYFLVTGLTG